MPEMYKLVDDLGGSVQTISSMWRPSPCILCKIVSMVSELVDTREGRVLPIISRAAPNTAPCRPEPSKVRPVNILIQPFFPSQTIPNIEI